MDPLLVALVWVAGTSVVTLSVTVWDKVQAQRHRGRIPERTLLGLALAGGSPGLVLAMVLVRHKTRKGSFLARLLLVLLVQAAFVAAWFWTQPA